MATKTLITTFGQRKIAEALANEDTIEVTAMVFGDGDGSQYTATVSQTQLKNQLYSTAAIAKVEDETWTYFEATIPESVSNFTIREIGLTCINDDTNQNELIIIATVPDTEKVVSEGGVLQTMPVRIGVTTSIGNVITIIVDPDSIPPFTNNNLGLIKGKNSDGYVQAKDGNTGFGSVVGWDNVFKKVSSTPQTINSDVIVSLGNTLYYRDLNNIQRTIITTSSNAIQIGNNNNLLNLQGSNLESSSTGLKIKSGNLNINNVSTTQKDITFNATNHRVATIRSSVDSNNQCQLLLGVNNTSDDSPGGLRLTRGTSGNAYIDQLPNIKTNIYEEKDSTCSFIGKNTAFNYTSTSTPSANVGIGQFICQDVNGKNVGGISINHSTSNNVVNTMYVRRSIGGTEKNAYLTIGVDNSGNPYATAPATPALSSNNTSIATTEFIKKYIQCGTFNIEPNSEATVYFSTAFPDQYISIAFARVSKPTQTIGVTYPMIRVIYTGSFRVYNPSNGDVTYTWIAVWRG